MLDTRCLFSAAKMEKNEVVANRDHKQEAWRQALQILVELNKMSPEFPRRIPTFLKGDIVRRQKPSTLSSEDKINLGWLKSLLSAVLGGFLVLAGQIFVNPIAAKRVRIQESITEKRYEACERAIELLQRRLASATITGKLVPESYTPPEKIPPTQLEMNAAYIQLLIYNKSQTLADEFFAATGPEKIEPSNIVKFVSTVRKELGVDDKDISKFQYRILFSEGEDGLQDKEVKDEQKK